MRCSPLISLGTLLLNALPALGSPTSRRVDEMSFATAEELFAINQHIGGSGLRGTASARQNVLIDWLDGQLRQVPGLDLSYSSFNLTRWEPHHDSLGESASLKLLYPGACSSTLNVAGAIPYTRVTNGDPVKAELLYVPPEKKLSTVNATNKIVIRDVAFQSVPFPLLFAVSNFRTADLDSAAKGNYSRYVSMVLERSWAANSNSFTSKSKTIYRKLQRRNHRCYSRWCPRHHFRLECASKIRPVVF